MTSNNNKKDDSIRASINAKLVETGERERLREMLQLKLIECGWRDQVRQQCKEIVRRHGFGNISVDEIVQELVPKSRAMVPDHIKKELLDNIRSFLAQQSDL